MTYSSQVMSPMSMRPKSTQASPPPSFHTSFAKSTTASTAPTTTELTVRVTESHHVRSGSFAIPAFRAVISRSPASLTWSTSVWKSATAAAMAERPGPSSHEASNMGEPPSAAAWLRASA